MKFGGTSMSSLSVIKQAAQHIKREWLKGYEIAVVVSAMDHETNDLIKTVENISSIYDAREFDAIISTGEQKSAGLMAVTLQSLEVPSRSWQAWQLPIITNERHTNALVESINCSGIIERFSLNSVAVVCGFQGCSKKEYGQRVTTLGRGGSDTTAVLLAVALNAERCDIYTDVDGVYTSDPKINPKAKIINNITHEEMLEFASQGASVMHSRSVAVAMNYNLPVLVRSTFNNSVGTNINKSKKGDEMETRNVTGIAHSPNEAMITLFNLSDQPGISAMIFGSLMEESIFVDMIIQSTSKLSASSDKGQTTNMTFTLNRSDIKKALSILKLKKKEIGYNSFVVKQDVAKVSVIGVGMQSTTGVAAQMFEALAQKKVNVLAISTSEIKISVIVDETTVELAVRTLHTAFGLDKTN